MTAYPWPGNVRELIQALEKALISAKEEPMLFPKHLPTYIRIHVARSAFPPKPASPAEPEMRPGVPQMPRTTIELAHHLLPRFLSRQGDDFEDLGQVLDKIYRTVH